MQLLRWEALNGEYSLSYVERDRSSTVWIRFREIAFKAHRARHCGGASADGARGGPLQDELCSTGFAGRISTLIGKPAKTVGRLLASQYSLPVIPLLSSERSGTPPSHFGSRVIDSRPSVHTPVRPQRARLSSAGQNSCTTPRPRRASTLARRDSATSNAALGLRPIAPSGSALPGNVTNLSFSAPFA